jgi:thiol-disulfide isomerase/thioredoxin
MQKIIIALSIIISLFTATLAVASTPNVRGMVINTNSGYKNVNLRRLQKTHNLILVNFFATWCPPCRHEIPVLESYYNRYKNKGFLVIGVDMNSTPFGVEGFLKGYGVSYPVTSATYNEVTDFGGVSEIPQSFFIYKNNVVLHWQGELSGFILQRVLSKIYK